MLFNSFEYLIFYAAFFALFFLLPTVRAQILFIALASLYFYSAWSPIYVLLLLGVCTIAWLAQRFEGHRHAVAAAVTALLGILFVFKYYNFFVTQLQGFGLSLNSSQLLLPVGISFYAFQAISFVIDHKRQHVKPVTFTEMIAYIAFFPQLVAGPIVRASVFIPQLMSKRKFNKQMFYTGICLFAMGMFKKVVIADNVGGLVDSIYIHSGETTAGNHLLAFYLYAVQIYYDFCGYSEMAIGIARTLGFKFPRNFDRPYLSASITEFWRRWHISLSSWLRDYLYISLGGNRKGVVRTYINLAMVMLLGGLWHGAAWTFVAWGALHGGLLAIERFFRYSPKTALGRFFGILITFHLVCISWVFFRSPDFASAWAFFGGMADWSTLNVVTTKFVVAKSLALIPLFLMIERFSQPRVFLKLRRPANLAVTLLIATALFLLLGNFAETPFIYFQF